MLGTNTYGVVVRTVVKQVSAGELARLESWLCHLASRVTLSFSFLIYKLG